MKKLFQLTLVTAAAIAVSAGSTHAETWENVAKKIGEASAKIKSMQYKMKIVQETKDPNMTNKSESEMSFEYVEKDGKIQYRQDLKTKSETKYEGGEMKNNITMQTVCDGDYIYTFSDTDGNKQATKSKVKKDSLPKMDQTDAMKEFEKNFEIKVLPDETVDGRPTFVVEMTPKDPQMKAYVGKMVSCYCKETGMPLKSTTYDGKGQLNSTTTLTEIKVNPTIAPDRFKFTPPAGVEVQDMTKDR